jgi:hypothetical protein
MKECAAPTPTIVMTIGHSTHSVKEFIRLLKAHGVQRLVDVRTVPSSRHNPQFNRSALSPALHSARLHYTYMGGLGGFRHARPDSLNAGWHNASFRGFADYMQTPAFRINLDKLIGLAKSERIAIMCAEAVPWRCHRSLIADALLARRIEVQEITSTIRTRPHTLTPWGKITRGQVTYPAEHKDQSKSEITPMKEDFKVGDHVEWSSEAGRVQGTIRKKHTSEIKFKGYTVHASKEEPQYLIKSDKTAHLAMHKGSALRKVPKSKI